MKNVILLTLFCFLAIQGMIAQNVGINNTDPKAALDINGGWRLRPVNTSVTGTSVVLNSTTGHHFVTGSPTGNFTIAFTPTVESGQHTIITNNTTFIGNIFAIQIKPQTTVELFFSNGEWKQIGSNETISSTTWSRTGNSGTIDGVNNFIGTLDAKPIRFIENNQHSGIMDAAKANYFFGGGSGYNSQPSSYGNSGFGFFAMLNNTTGSSNVAVGSASLQSNKQGSYITAVGGAALYNDTAANETVAVGAQALYWNQARFGNTAVGTNSLFWNTFTNTTPILAHEGLYNTALGHSALFNNQRGSGGVAIGYKAAYSNTTAIGVVAIGRAALYNNQAGHYNTAIGDSALYNNGIGEAIGGYHAGSNVAVGSRVLFQNTIGSFNTALGVLAMGTNVSGSYNTAIGNYSALGNVTGDHNTSIGSSALQKNRFSNFNVAIGVNALPLYDAPVEEDGNNVAIGVFALGSHVTGVENVAIGNDAMNFNLSGARNTAIGYEAGEECFYGNGNVFIGYQSGKHANNTYNKLYIENSPGDSLEALIYGDFQSDSLVFNADVNIKDFTRLGSRASAAPAIKMKKLVVPSSGSLTGEVGIAHLLNASKIISVTSLLQWTTGTFAPPEYSGDTQLRYNFYVTPTEIRVRNNATGGSLILNKPVTLLITYEE